MATTRQEKNTQADSNNSNTDRGWAWVVAVAGMVNILLSIGVSQTLGILMVELLNVYDITSTTEVSLIVTYSGLGYSLATLVFIFGLGDLFHERALLVCGGLLSSLGFLVTYFSSTVHDLYVFGFCTGAARQITFACSAAIVGTYFKKRLAVGNGILMSGVSLGVLALPPFTRWLFDGYTYRGAALIMAAITLNILVCAAIMRPKDATVGKKVKHTNKAVSFQENATTRASLESACNPTTTGGTNQPSTDETTAGYTHPSFTESSQSLDMSESYASIKGNTDSELPEDKYQRKWINICFKSARSFVVKDRHKMSKQNSVIKNLGFSFTFFKSPCFIFYQLFIYFTSTATEALLQFYPVFTTELGMSLYQSAFLLSIVGGADLFGKIIFGLLGDSKILQRYTLVMVNQYIMGCVCLLSRFATDFWSQVVFAIAIGIFYGSSDTFRAVLLVDLFGIATLLRRMGISNLFTGMAYASAGPLIGYIRDATSDYRLPLQVIGAIFFASGSSLLAMGCCQRRLTGRQVTHR